MRGNKQKKHTANTSHKNHERKQSLENGKLSSEKGVKLLIFGLSMNPLQSRAKQLKMALNCSWASTNHFSEL